MCQVQLAPSSGKEIEEPDIEIDLEKENMSFQLQQEAAMPCPLQHSAVSSSQGLAAYSHAQILRPVHSLSPLSAQHVHEPHTCNVGKSPHIAIHTRCLYRLYCSG